MILTEEEAKTKRCQEGFWPYAPMHSKDSAAPLTCIGSECMAWRWKRGSVYVPDVIDKTLFTKYEDKGDYSTTHGYCGKAGRP